MSVYGLSYLFGNLEPALCVVVLITMAARKSLRTYKYLTAYIATRVAVFLLSAPFVLHRHTFGWSDMKSYNVVFIIYWIGWAIRACLALGIIISVYKLAMAPLKGLQGLGMMMFRWAAGISIAIAITIAFGPHVSAFNFFIRAVTQLQQTESVLTLCMLLFVCLAIHPMGLSYRSRIFGVSLGLGMIATTELVQSAWIPVTSSLNSMFSLINAVAVAFTLLLWTGYFAVPEPKRRMIVLPTTSPFLRWNQISQVLGDEPGFVALGEVGLDMFAPAEIEVMRRASNKMNNVMNY